MEKLFSKYSGKLSFPRSSKLEVSVNIFLEA